MTDEIPDNAEIECFIGMTLTEAKSALDDVGIEYRTHGLTQTPFGMKPSRGDCAIFSNRVNLRTQDGITVSDVWYG